MNGTDRANRAWTIRLKLKGKELGKWVVAEQPLTIGRDLENDIVIENLSVSRRHAVLEPCDEGIRVRDCESLNGISVNGEEVDSTTLRHGDVITIGKHRIEIRLESAGHPATFDPTIATDKETLGPKIENPAELVELTESGERTHVLDQPVIIIGCGESSDIRVEGRFIAAYHAEILYDEGSYVLRHVEGRRKVKVDGKSVVECVLEHGCEISLGGRTFLFFKERVGAESD